MRYLFPLVSMAAIGVAVLAVLRPSGAEPAAKADDPWVGTYLYYAEYDHNRQGQFGEARKITISKDGDIYKLSKPFDNGKFRETKKGVLSDEKGGLGKLFLGSMEFSDGVRARVLRADFCYETFTLVSDLDRSKKPGAATWESPEKKPALSLAEAEKLVRTFILTQNPKMNPKAEFPLKDLTVKAVWDRLGVQVFQVTEGVQVCETYVIKDKQVYRIGQGFGGQ